MAKPRQSIWQRSLALAIGFVAIAVVVNNSADIATAQPEPALELLNDCRAVFGGDDSNAYMQFSRQDGQWQLISLYASYCDQVDLKPLSHFRAIKTLDISNARGPEHAGIRATVATIEKYDRLVELSIEAKDLVDMVDLDHSKFTSIETLRLSGEKPAIDFVLSHLSAFPKLKTLELDGKLTDSSFTHLYECAALESLAIRYANITDETLTEIVKLHDLRKLDFSGPRSISAEGIKKLAALRKLSELTLEDVDQDVIAALATLPALTTLVCDFVGNEADLRGLPRLRTWKRPDDSPSVESPPLKVFLPRDIETICCSYECLPTVVDANASHVDVVEVYGYWDTDESIVSWVRTLPNVSQLNVTAASNSDIADIVTMENLRSLSLVHPCSHYGGKEFMKLNGLKQIENLELAIQNAMGNTDLTFLESFGNLKRLSIPYWDLAESELHAISRLNNLRSISLRFSDDENDDLEGVFQRLMVLDNLEELSITGSLTDKRLERVPLLKSLRRLDVSRTRGYSDAALAKLMTKMPSLQEVIK